MIIGNIISISPPFASSVDSFNSRILLTTNTDETTQYVTLTKRSGMKADYSDVRFIIDPDGTNKEKFFMDYELVSYDGSSANFKVSYPTATVGSTFYAVWGKQTISSSSNPYLQAFSSGWLSNYFDRTPRYDVSNVFANYDTLLEGPGDASIEANWPCCTQQPISQTTWGTPQNSDWERVYVGYKYDEDDNSHSGSPTSKAALKYSLDFGATWSSRQYIYDPDASYRSTSSSSVTIPTSGATEVTFTVEAGRAWQAGDIARAFVNETTYFWFTVTSYSGTTLVGTRLSHSGTGTYASWVISQRFGATNTVITSVKTDTTVRLIAAFARIDFYNTEGTGAGIARVFSSYSDLTDGVPGAWSEPVQISDNNWSNVGGKATTSHDGIVWMTYHQDAITTADWASCVAYSRDYGVTWDRVRVTSPANVQLNETDLIQLQDETTGEWINKLKATVRNENSATTSNHQYSYEITWDDNSVSATAASENAWYDSTVSRYTSVRCPDWVTIYYTGGDATEKMLFTRDECQTYKPVPIATLNTSALSARRVYTVMAVHPDGRMMKIWASNKLSNGSDLYINYWDWTLNQLYCDTSLTLTNGAGVRNRPTDLNDGIRIGEWLTGYRTSSTTSISVPTGAGQQRTLTVATGLNWQAGDTGCCVYTTNNGVRFTFTVISYNSGTGELVVEWIANTGTGTQATWQINIGTADNTGNLLTNQAYLSIPKVTSNGQVRPSKTTLRVTTAGTGGVTGGLFGMKRFETRATSVITITNAGAAGDVITIKWKKSGTYTGLFGGLGTLATYTVQNGDDIAAVVNGLVASANSIGISPVSASDSTTLTIIAPFGNNTAINTFSPTVEVTGTVAGSAAAFSGGTAIESATSLSNIILLDNGNNVARVEQANDNYSAAFTVNDGPIDYTYEWDGTDVNVSNGTTTVTKTSANGSGVPNWEGQVELLLTTSPSSPQGILNIYKMIQEPLTQTPATEGAVSTGAWSERTDGRGLA